MAIKVNGIKVSGSGGGSSVKLDPTLTESGFAADAKAVGDAVSGLQVNIDEVSSILSQKADVSAIPSLEGLATETYVGSQDDATLASAKSYTDTAIGTLGNTYYTESEIDTQVSALNASIAGKADASHPHSIENVTDLQSSLDAKVPVDRTVNGKTLSDNIYLTAADVGAATTQDITDALAGFSAQPFALGTSAPSNTNMLWIDTTANTGGLKYYNGTSWVHVPVAYT